ncbi:MAG: tetratricopeptide repeat protein, partial [Planctomycetota bacterium]
WSLVHFLMKDKRYCKKFEKFVKDIPNGKGVKRVAGAGAMRTVEPQEVFAHFKKCLGLKTDADLKKLEEEWHAYVKDVLQVKSARGLETAAVAAVGSDRPIRAQRLFKEAIEKGTKNALTFYRYAELLHHEAKNEEAIPYYRKAVKYGPLEASFYAGLGRALVLGGKEDEGIRNLKLALELDPDDPYLADEIEMFLKMREGGK